MLLPYTRLYKKLIFETFLSSSLLIIFSSLWCTIFCLVRIFISHERLHVPMWMFVPGSVARGAHIFIHDDVIKWKHFLCYWPFVRGSHRLPLNSPHKGQWRGALMLSFICAWINDWVNNREASDLRCHRAYYDVIVMILGTVFAKQLAMYFVKLQYYSRVEYGFYNILVMIMECILCPWI